MGLQSGEKKSINIYYNYKDAEFELLSDSQLRNVIYCLIDIDKNGKITEEKARYEEIQDEKTARLVFKSLLERNTRASMSWHKINNLKKGKREIKSIMESEGCTEAEAKKIYDESKAKEPKETLTAKCIFRYRYITEDENDSDSHIEILLENPNNKSHLPTYNQLNEAEEGAGRDIVKHTIEYGNVDDWTFPYEHYLDAILATEN